MARNIQSVRPRSRPESFFSASAAGAGAAESGWLRVVIYGRELGDADGGAAPLHLHRVAPHAVVLAYPLAVADDAKAGLRVQGDASSVFLEGAGLQRPDAVRPVPSLPLGGLRFKRGIAGGNALLVDGAHGRPVRGSHSLQLHMKRCKREEFEQSGGVAHPLGSLALHRLAALAAPAARRTAGHLQLGQGKLLGRWNAAGILGQAGRLLGGQHEIVALAGQAEFADGGLLVLHLNVQVLGAQDALRQIQNVQKLQRSQPVVVVASFPQLEVGHGFAPLHAAAVDEVLAHQADFRDVEVRGQQLRIEAVADGEALDFTAYQIQRLQFLQVLRYGGAGQGQLGGDVAGDAGLLAGQELDDGHPRRVMRRKREGRWGWRLARQPWRPASGKAGFRRAGRRAARRPVGAPRRRPAGRYSRPGSGVAGLPGRGIRCAAPVRAPRAARDEPRCPRWKTVARQRGELREVASRIYSSDLVTAPEVLIRKNWLPVVQHLFPGALISHRSQLEGQPTAEGHLFLTYKYTRNVELPGLVVHLLEGPAPLPGDAPFGDGTLLFASEARGLLENLQPARVRKGGVSKALPLASVEERLEMVLRIRGEEGLNALRDQAREVAAALDWPTELALLQRIVGALLSTQSSKILTSPVARARALGLPFDAGRLALFTTLLSALRAAVLPQRPDPAP
nr:hypothetical protein [Tanacetum cinerariifolium]